MVLEKPLLSNVDGRSGASIGDNRTNGADFETDQFEAKTQNRLRLPTTIFLLWEGIISLPVSYTHLTLPTTPYV